MYLPPGVGSAGACCRGGSSWVNPGGGSSCVSPLDSIEKNDKVKINAYIFILFLLHHSLKETEKWASKLIINLLALVDFISLQVSFMA